MIMCYEEGVIYKGTVVTYLPEKRRNLWI